MHTQHSGVDQADVSLYQAFFQQNWCFVHHLVEPLCAPVLVFVKAVFIAQVFVSVNVPHVSIFWWNVIFLKKYRQKFLGESCVNTLFHVSDVEFVT